MLRAFLQSAWKAGLVTENVGSKVEIVKPSQDITKRRAFTVPELQGILEAAGNSEWRGLILFGIYTGARLGDIALLTWENVHGLESKNPEVRFKTRKTSRQQILSGRRTGGGGGQSAYSDTCAQGALLAGFCPGASSVKSGCAREP